MAWCCLALLNERHYAIVVACILFADVACSFAVCVLSSTNSEPGDKELYRSFTIDSIFLSLVRCFMFPALMLFIVYVWRRKASTSPFRDALNLGAARPGQNDMRRQHNNTELESTSATLRAPLRDGEGKDETSENGDSAASTSAGYDHSTLPPSGCGSVSMDSVSAREAFEMKRDHSLILELADKHRNLAIATFFMLSTAMSIYGGIKSVEFHYHPRVKSLQAVLLGSVVLWVNAEFFLLVELAKKKTEEKGEMTRLHLHPLYFSLGLKCHTCDICHERTKEPHFIAYRCRTCDFDLCPTCYRRKDNPNFKGGMLAIRSDGDEQVTTWSYFSRCMKLAMDFRRTLMVTIICLLLSQGLSLAAPRIQGNIFDSILAWLKREKDGRERFVAVMSVYTTISVLQGLFGGLKALTTELVMRKLASSVRAKLFVGIVRMDVSFFDAMHTGQLTSRLSNDASGMVQPMQVLINDLVANAITLVGGLFMSFITSWRLSVLALTVVPPITFVYRLYARWSRKLNRSIWQAYGDSNSVATEAISNIRTVKAFSTEQYENDRYADGVNTALKHGVKNAYVGASVSAFSTYLNLGTAVLILWYGGTIVCESKQKEMTFGELITFQLYFNMMNSSFIALGNVFNELIRASSAAERVLALMDTVPEHDPDAGDELSREDIRGHLALHDLEFFYATRPENQVLKKICLEMMPNTVTALVGKSGGGKSTLVHLLMRFYEPTGGTISLDGRHMRELSARSIRRWCGFVAQDTQLFATSIEENLVYGLGRPHTTGEVYDAAKQANAHDFIMEMDEGYETRVGEKGIMLSGGQKQRLAVARCFLRKPKLLFLDEATSALDAENEALVQKALDELVRLGDCTIVLIAHRLSTVIDADQIAVVHKGNIVECGPHSELAGKEGGVYAKLVQRQLARDANTMIEERDNSPKNKKPAERPTGTGTEIDELFEEAEIDCGVGVASGES